MVDSLQIFEILKSANIAESQARAMTLAIQKAESAVASELKDVTKRLEDRMDRFEERLGELRIELHQTKTELIRWNFAFWVAQLAAIAAILKLLK